MITYSHSGHMGDILYSLHFVKQHLKAHGQDKCIYSINLDVPQHTVLNHPNGAVRMTQKAYQYLKPLLQAVPFVDHVQSTSNRVPQGAVDIDLFRQNTQNFRRGGHKGLCICAMGQSGTPLNGFP